MLGKGYTVCSNTVNEMETLASLLHNKTLHNEILGIKSSEEPVSKFYIFMAAGHCNFS